jgi:small-conductance mechanosensitive channel
MGNEAAKVRELEHELLRARDESIGLRAELTQARVRLDELARTPVGDAYTRIDALESERQALYDYVTAVRAATQKQIHDAHQDLLHSMQASATWRVGRLVLAPVSIVRRTRRR